MNDIIGYGLYGDEVGFYAVQQPYYDYSFTKDLDKAKIWKTLSFDNELTVTSQKYDPSVRVVKIKRVTVVTCDPNMTPDEEIAEWNILLQQYDDDADAMSIKNYKRFRILKKFVEYFGVKR